MNKSLASIYVFVAPPVVFVKIAGRANFSSSAHFKTLVQELKQRGFQQFVMELTECITMDSTFLGVLAGLALQASEFGRLRLVNPNARVTELLDNLGISHLFAVTQEGPVLQAKPVDLSPTEPATKEELAQTSLEAHQTLMEVNPANIPKFKEVTQFLAEDLKNLRNESKKPGGAEGKAG